MKNIRAACGPQSREWSALILQPSARLDLVLGFVQGQDRMGVAPSHTPNGSTKTQSTVSLDQQKSSTAAMSHSPGAQTSAMAAVDLTSGCRSETFWSGVLAGKVPAGSNPHIRSEMPTQRRSMRPKGTDQGSTRWRPPQAALPQIESSLSSKNLSHRARFMRRLSSPK